MINPQRVLACLFQSGKSVFQSTGFELSPAKTIENFSAFSARPPRFFANFAVFIGRDMRERPTVNCLRTAEYIFCLSLKTSLIANALSI
jgi:hypothetical protein